MFQNAQSIPHATSSRRSTHDFPHDDNRKRNNSLRFKKYKYGRQFGDGRGRYE
jgi:hypothetical protein